MILSFIAAIGKNNELGKGNDLVWRFPEDQKFFRETTSGHPIIMGRKTFESIGRPLPDRRNIVITRDKTYLRHGVDIAHSLDEALNLVKDTENEVFIIGGAEIFKQSMSMADKLYITHVEAEDKSADIFFPNINESEWQEVSREEHEMDEKNPYKYAFVIYERF